MHRLLLPSLFLLLAGCIGGPKLVPLGQGGGASPTRSLYLREIVGRYGSGPICAGTEGQVEFAPDSVYLGETGCNITATGPADGGVSLTLTACRAEGTPAPDRTLNVAVSDNGALTLSGDGRSRSVQPCFD